MKKVVIVVDSTVPGEIEDAKKIQKLLRRKCDCILHEVKPPESQTKAFDSLDLLLGVKKAISVFDKGVTVMYTGGERTSLLRTLPCQIFDLGEMMNKLKKMLGTETPEQIKMVAFSYTHALISIVK